MFSPHIYEWIGSVAACLTTLAFLPQVLRVWRTKSVTDISFTTYVMLSIGVFLWLVYGIGIDSRPVIVANAVTFCLAFSILVQKVYYSRKR